ncbi:MAG: hypothetical protein J6D00_08610 [Christensenellaceae bacterium]|nr:hypothetical protein [Christensenellaceae bacterium]
MTNIRINYENNTIEIGSKFAKDASKFGSEQYKELKEARTDFPAFEVKVIKNTVKRNDTFKGLTIAYMEKYISLHNEDGSIMTEFNILRGKVENEDELTAKASYGEIKKWFLAKYPEIKEARNEIVEIMKKVA